MNANFRRDYLYKFKDNHLDGITEGMKLRYLKFDRKTKEYIFIEGSHRQPDEMQLRIAQTKSGYIGRRIQKLGYIGYAETDQYRTQKYHKEVKGVKRPVLADIKDNITLTSTFITDFSELRVGKVYKFNDTDFISTKPLLLESIVDNASGELRTLDGRLTQIVLKRWINNGDLTCELVD